MFVSAIFLLFSHLFLHAVSYIGSFSFSWLDLVYRKLFCEESVYVKYSFKVFGFLYAVSFLYVLVVLLSQEILLQYHRQMYIQV